MTVIANLTNEEFDDLKWCIGEYRRICREQQSTNVVANSRYSAAQTLYKKLVEDQKI